MWTAKSFWCVALNILYLMSLVSYWLISHCTVYCACVCVCVFECLHVCIQYLTFIPSFQTTADLTLWQALMYWPLFVVFSTQRQQFSLTFSLWSVMFSKCHIRITKRVPQKCPNLQRYSTLIKKKVKKNNNKAAIAFMHILSWALLKYNRDSI